MAPSRDAGQVRAQAGPDADTRENREPNFDRPGVARSNRLSQGLLQCRLVTRNDEPDLHNPPKDVADPGIEYGFGREKQRNGQKESGVGAHALPERYPRPFSQGALQGRENRERNPRQKGKGQPRPDEPVVAAKRRQRLVEGPAATEGKIGRDDGLGRRRSRHARGHTGIFDHAGHRSCHEDARFRSPLSARSMNASTISGVRRPRAASSLSSVNAYSGASAGRYGRALVTAS